jgi:hypothetical protein
MCFTVGPSPGAAPAEFVVFGVVGFSFSVASLLGLAASTSLPSDCACFAAFLRPLLSANFS